MFSRKEDKSAYVTIRKSDVENFLRKAGHYTRFEDGSARCYVCGTAMTSTDQIGIFFVDRRREGDPAIVKRSIVDRLLGRKGKEVRYALRYTCDDISCVYDVKSRFPF